MTAADILAGSGAYERAMTPEPLLLAYLARHCLPEELVDVAYQARIYADDPAGVFPVPAIAAAVAAVVATRVGELTPDHLILVADQLPSLGERIAVGSSPSGLLAAHTAVRTSDAALASDAVTRSSGDQRLLAHAVVLPLVGNPDDVADLLIGEMPWVPVAAMERIAGVASEQRQRALVDSWARSAQAPETRVAGLVAMLPRLDPEVRVVAAVAATDLVSGGALAYVHEWRAAYTVARLRTAVAAGDAVITQLAQRFDEPWRTFISGLGSGPEDPYAELLAAHPYGSALAAETAPAREAVTAALYGMIDTWGGSAPVHVLPATGDGPVVVDDDDTGEFDWRIDDVAGEFEWRGDQQQQVPYDDVVTALPGSPPKDDGGSWWKRTFRLPRMRGGDLFSRGDDAAAAPDWSDEYSGDDAAAAPDWDGGEAVAANGNGDDGGEPVAANGDGEPPDDGAPSEDPPRTSYARMDCDKKLTVGEEFELVVGLASRPSPGVVGGELRRPESSVGAYDLWIHVTAEGFRLAEGETWRRGIPVTAQDPYPTTTYHLTPEPTGEETSPAAIKATFTVDGQVIGWAVRPVVIISAGTDPDEVAEPPEPGLDIGVPTAGAGADLFLTFEYSRDKQRLLLKLETGFDDVDVPDAPIEVDIGADAGTYAQGVINRVDANEGDVAVYYELRGVSKELAGLIEDDAFWDVMDAVVTRCRTEGRRPAVLILSEDPYVPWELMSLEIEGVRDVRYDTGTEPFLGAQADVGRWLLDRPKPAFPPVMSKAVGPMAMVWSDYSAVPTPNLDAAKLEAQALTAAPYAAADVAATRPNLFATLKGTPPADVLHFAVHGRYDPNSIEHGLLLGDEKVVSPSQVLGAGVTGSPFVYLNACQVGTGSQTLGGYSGMAAAFLRAGACAVVAPLWSVKDVVAKDIALHFYEVVFGGQAPAAVLREERAKFTEAAATSATYLAYQFFGHPKMKLTRS